MTVYSTEKVAEIRETSRELVADLNRAIETMGRLSEMTNDIDPNSSPEANEIWKEAMPDEARMAALVIGLYKNVAQKFPSHVALPFLSHLQMMSRNIVAFEIHSQSCSNHPDNKPVDFPSHVDEDLKPIGEEAK